MLNPLPETVFSPGCNHVEGPTISRVFVVEDRKQRAKYAELG